MGIYHSTISKYATLKAVILFTKHVTQQLGNREFRGTFAQLGVDDFVPQLWTETRQLETRHLTASSRQIKHIEFLCINF